MAVTKSKKITKKKKAAKNKIVFSIISYLTWAVISFLAATLIIFLINLLAKNIWDNLSSNNTYKSIASILFDVIFIVILFLPYKIFKKPLPTREELGLKGWPTWTDILLAAIGFIAYLVIASILTEIFKLLPFFDADQKQKTIFDYLLPGLEMIFAYISVAVVPPIVEEVIFRGWLYKNLRTKISGRKSKIISILLVSILFGAMHGQWNAGVSIFAMSVVLCLLRELTGTIYGGILMHITANTIYYSLCKFNML